MPLEFLPAAIAGASNLIGGAIQSGATAKQNRLSREWSERMYNRQFTDNVRFWNQQNAYNTPEQQMARFKQAGLNPHLIYGQGNSGNAAQISTPDVQRPEFRVPELGNAVASAGTALSQYLDYEIKQAQIDNLKADNTVKLEEAALKEAQRLGLGVSTARGQFDLDLESELRQYSLDYRREQARGIKVQSDMALSRNEREIAKNASDLKEAAERILTARLERTRTELDKVRIREQIKNIRSDTRLKELDTNLKEVGVQPHDNILFRILGQLLQNPSYNRFFKN